jgi:hypothetical protein
MHEDLIGNRLLVDRLSLNKPWQNAHSIGMINNGSLVVRSVSSILETLLVLGPHAHGPILGGEMNEGGDSEFIWG